MKTELRFYHDKHLKRPFDLFEDLYVRDATIDVDKGKIKLPGYRIRKFSRTFTASGMGEYRIIGSFVVKNVKYYFNYIETNEDFLSRD
jgi:hypothetical protein